MVISVQMLKMKFALQHQKRKKKRAQQAAKKREATHEVKLIEVLEVGPASQWKLKVYSSLYSSRRLEIQSLQLWFQAVATRKNFYAQGACYD